MCEGPAFLGTRLVVRFAFAGMTAALLAGCADSSRFLGDPLGNPFKSASVDPTPTASYDAAPPPYRPMPSSSIESRPLPPPSALPSRHVASYEAAAHASPRLTQTSMPPSTDRTASIAAASGHGSWSTKGGMSVIAGTGDTAGILADRYNVPSETLLRVNGLSSSSQVRPGTRLIIPVYSASGAPAAHVASAAPKVHDHSSRERLLAKHEAAHEKMHWVTGPQPAKVAETEKPRLHDKASKLDHKKRSADNDAMPAEKPARVAKVETSKDMAPKPAKSAVAEKRIAVDPTPTASLPPASEKIAQSDSPEFRWPAHGRIIQGFRSGGNDGINIAVPEGTSVKAAESGVVAYAGSDIKGFGNLVLIRHPNGYVTAYANNSDLAVHRGEQVTRGQTIAKSGQSGNVASPQLHFELRKGSTPVDPTRYLAGL